MNPSQRLLISEHADRDLVFHLAREAMKTTLAPFLQTKSPGFVITAVVPAADRLSDYVAACEHLLCEHERQEGIKTASEVVAVTRAFRPATKGYSSGSRVVFVGRREHVSRALTLVSDRVETIADVSREQVRKAVKALYGVQANKADTDLIAKTPWRELRLAFRRGRGLDDAIERLRADGSMPVPAAAEDERNLGLEQMSGYGDAKAWGISLARDIAAWRSGSLLWRDVDRGILLAGPPGTGKTVFAKALANTCEANLVSTSLARWQASGYLNDLLAAMHASFQEAKEKAPAILFVDEVDSVGRRDEARGGHASYHRQVVNSFLEELDGAAGREGVVVVCATNRPEHIDPALLRPGRLERTVKIGLPSPEDRVAILKWHAGLDVDQASRLIEETEGFTGADLEALARSARRAARDAGATLSVGHLESCLPARAAISEADRWRIAVHEAGHALACVRLRVAEFAGIVLSRSVAADVGFVSAGHTRISTQGIHLNTRQDYLDQIAFLEGGMAAEVVLLGTHSSGAGGWSNSDLARATELATQLVAAAGMDEFLIVEELGSPETYRMARTANPAIWGRVNAILTEQMARVTEMMRSEMGLLETIAAKAFEQAYLSASDLATLLQAHSGPDRSS